MAVLRLSGVTFYIGLKTQGACGIAQARLIGERCDEWEVIALIVATHAVGTLCAPAESLDGAPLGCERNIGYRGMVNISIDLHTLGTDSHRTQAVLKLSDDVVREEEGVGVEPN